MRNKRLKDLPKTALPREKMQIKGGQNLSEVELLALLLGTGKPKKNVLLLARSLLGHYPLSKLPTVSFSQLIGISGIGKSKATRVMAALELGQRIFGSSSLSKSLIKSSADVLKEIKEIADKKQEHIVGLYLNARHQLIQKEMVALGNLNSSLIEPREIFAPAIQIPAAYIVLAHNHPSGDSTPSKEDIIFTRRIQAAGEILGIPLVDHLIVCPHSYFSFKEGLRQ